MRYYISDLHFFHDNLNKKMDNRGFDNAYEMNEYMIKQWNSRIKKKDEVVVLGDFSIGKAEETNEILKRLNGKKCLIIGNHDKFIMKKNFDTTLVEWVHHYREMSDNSRKIILSHYPIFCYNGQYKRDKNGTPRTYMLYGHVHNTFDEFLVNEFQNQTRKYEREINGEDEKISIPCQMINCFCMFSDYVPMTLDEWIEIDAKRRREFQNNIK